MNLQTSCTFVHFLTSEIQNQNFQIITILIFFFFFFCAFSFPGSPQFSPVGVGYTTAYNYNAQGLPVSYNGQVTVDGQVFTVDPNQQVIRNTEEIDLGKSSAPPRLMKLVVRAYADSASVPIHG